MVDMFWEGQQEKGFPFVSNGMEELYARSGAVVFDRAHYSRRPGYAAGMPYDQPKRLRSNHPHIRVS